MWARATLAEHAGDPRRTSTALEQLEAAAHPRPLWNAAQRQLVRDGTIHNYLRMLWGKKILEWSPDPSTALAALTDLNNKYALDGRNPNSYSGIFWIARPLRPRLGPRAPRLRQDPLHEQRQHRPQAPRRLDYLARYAA
jgi:deoxyribodipyrimidine photo-lyase